MKKKNMFHAIASMLMAAVFILGSMTSVQAKMTTLNDSGVTYVDYDEYAEMVLSSDGKTLIFNYSGYKNGEAVSAYNLKKYIPSKILKKFEDGEVYLYEKEVYWYDECDEDTTLAAVKKQASADGKYKITTEHRDYDDMYDSTITKHTKNDGAYYAVFRHVLRSDSKGKGVMSVKNSDPRKYCKVRTGSLAGILSGVASDKIDSPYYLADKNGKKVINIAFTGSSYDTSKLEAPTTTLESAVGHCGDIVLTAGETFSTKLKVTGGKLRPGAAINAIYNGDLVSITKGGKITAKSSYGCTVLTVMTGGREFFYYIYVTDGSSKMLKAIQSWQDKHNTSDCTLTVDKNGKYTIKKY